MPTEEELALLNGTPKKQDPPQKLTAQSLGGLKVQSVVEQVSTFNMMIYGNPGVGKTRLCGSASDVEALSPVLIIDAEGGTMSLKRLYPKVEAVRVEKWAQLQDVYDELYRNKHGYKTVVIDSLSEIQDYAMANTMADLMKKGRASGEEVDPDVPAQREYGINRTQTRKFVRAYRDLPVNTIFTGLALEDKDKKTNLTTIKPSLTGKARNEVPGFIDYVFYMYVKEQQRCLLTTTTDKVTAKTRNETLPEVITDPTMEQIYTLMNGDNTKNES